MHNELKYSIISVLPESDFQGKENVDKVMTRINQKEIDAKIYFHPDVPVRSLESHLEVYGGNSEDVLKCLCYVGKQGPLVVIAPGDVAIDNKKLAEASGYNKISMAKIDELKKFFNRGPGEVDPITIPDDIPVLIEEKLLDKIMVVGSCGSPHVGLGLRPIDIVANSHGKVVSLSR